MFLISELPKSIIINRNNYKIRTDFRTWIDVERVLVDDEIPAYYKLFILSNNVDLFLGYEDVFDEPMDAIFESILSFWRLNREDKYSSRSKKKHDIAYDYEQDFDLISAAFKQQYDLDLRKANMHWFEYKALFDGLTKETQFVKIVGYRTTDLDKVPKEQKKQYRELKEMYAVKKKSSRRRSQKEIEAELLAK